MTELSADARQIKKAVNRAKTGIFKPFKVGERIYKIKCVEPGYWYILTDDRGYLLSTGAAYPSATARIRELTPEALLVAVQRLQDTYAEAVDLMARGW